jgi:hypothetical protein
MVMTDMQFYIAVALPVFAFLLNIGLGVIQTNSIQAPITSVETNMNARFGRVENRLAGIEARFDTRTGKVIEIDNRLTRLEERLGR